MDCPTGIRHPLADPRAWLGLLGRPTTAPVELLDTNASALPAEVHAADHVTAGVHPSSSVARVGRCCSTSRSNVSYRAR